MAYLNVDEVESAIEVLSSTYSNICNFIALPNQTIDGRTSHALIVGSDFNNNKNSILFTGAVHAREWGGSDICVSFAADIIEAYNSGTGLRYQNKYFDKDIIRKVIEEINIIVFPQVNPDGRHHSQTTEALWRRNRNTMESGGNPNCIGVDLNRNYDFLWDFPKLFSDAAFVSTSTSSCDPSQTYRGSAPFSEPETKNVKWLFDQYPQIRWYVDIHCHGEKIFHVWGDDEIQTDNDDMKFTNPSYNSLRGIEGDNDYKEYVKAEDLNPILDLANRFHDGIYAVRGRDYGVEPSYSLYATSGAGDDYAYSRHLQDNTKSKIFGFTIEYGRMFQPPWSEMQNIIMDISAGILEFCLGTLEQ